MRTCVSPPSRGRGSKLLTADELAEMAGRPPRGGVDRNRADPRPRMQRMVAPLAGAWIETTVARSSCAAPSSPPSRGRGSKRCGFDGIGASFRCLPYRSENLNTNATCKSTLKTYLSSPHWTVRRKQASVRSDEGGRSLPRGRCAPHPIGVRGRGGDSTGAVITRTEPDHASPRRTVCPRLPACRLPTSAHEQG